LDVTDIATGRTEPRAVRNKAQRWVLEALMEISAAFPFPIKGIDSDNGSEFINAHLLGYCTDNKTTFTRSRAGHKNEGAHVEQKNWSVVRQAVGYHRYDTAAELALLNEIYALLRLLINFFSPQQKLIDKRREGAKVIKRYDTAQTPYQRVLADPRVSKKVKQALTAQYRQLNPAQLRRDLLALNERLLILVKAKHQPNRAARSSTGSDTSICTGASGGVVSSRSRQGSIDAAVRCYYANDPASRPLCTLTAVVMFGTVALCLTCRPQRSSVGKGTPAVPLPAGPELEVLDWVGAAHQQAAAAERTLAAAVARARQTGQPWSGIGARLGISRQAAQQGRSARRGAPPSTPTVSCSRGRSPRAGQDPPAGRRQPARGHLVADMAVPEGQGVGAPVSPVAPCGAMATRDARRSTLAQVLDDPHLDVTSF